MTYIFLVIILAVIAIVTTRAMKNKNKRFPSNNYTPFNNIVSGKNEDEPNHPTHYQEEKKDF